MHMDNYGDFPLKNNEAKGIDSGTCGKFKMELKSFKRPDQKNQDTCVCEEFYRIVFVANVIGMDTQELEFKVINPHQ